ncbi:hypothetical protein GcM3_190014 [Golovinomyces cichoracearum]|uniref:Hyphal anastamosis-8 protein n=1 Tax=Golovinomyces cichoracearum TaxID=62708 RepID=A0A420HI93_9PEZI|nr:hypothetical protein GcM3_190014 [Golovinomyces cichoracearum]
MACKLAHWPYDELIAAPSTSRQNGHTTSVEPEIQATKPPVITAKKARKPRFIESTAVHSPIEYGPSNKSSALDHSTQSPMVQIQPSDVGLTYLENSNRLSDDILIEMPHTSKRNMNLGEADDHSTPRREGINQLSPTFREEQTLQKCEKLTEKEQAKDLKVKTKVRIAKLFLRAVSFGCSLIVLTMVSASFSIFNATKSLPPRNHLPAWATGTRIWPQAFVLVIACISLIFCLVIFWNYYRGGHRKAEKVAVYYTLFTVTLFIFGSIMWGVAAGVLQGSRSNGQNKDLWGWSCVDNKRRQLFSDRVNYALVCRMQNWALVCCIIEIVLESITILLYAFVFYRFYSKQRLRKSMNIRDRARSELYSAQIRSQSALIEPCVDSNLPSSQDKRFPDSIVEKSSPNLISAFSAKPFCLQPPPQKGSSTAVRSFPKAHTAEQVVKHVVSVPGETIYDAVPIPSDYRSNLTPHEHP